jgi:hypothetical protein
LEFTTIASINREPEVKLAAQLPPGLATGFEMPIVGVAKEVALTALEHSDHGVALLNTIFEPQVSSHNENTLRPRPALMPPTRLPLLAAHTRADAPGILGGELESLPRNFRATRRVALGIYRGLRFGLVLHPHSAPDVYLEGAATCQSGFLREHQGPRAVLNAVERLANAYGAECEGVRQDQTRLGKPFLHDTYLSELTTLRDQLKAGLSGKIPEPGTEPQLTVFELAEKINLLKAANTIEATPQRAGKRHSSAEEPVTTRLTGSSQSVVRKPSMDQEHSTSG